MFEQVLPLIEKYNIITIFRHTNPDFDAYGSQFGLKSWIQDNYPNKQVYALGENNSTLFDECDVIEDEIIKSSLALILDTANSARIDDNRYNLALASIKIDHHPSVENFATYNYVNSSYAATCEAITEFIKIHSDKILSKKTAELLYRGLLTDTLCFKTNNTTSNTLMMAAHLASTGIKLSKINDDVFNKSLSQVEYINFLRSKMIIDGKIAYACISLDDQKRFNINSNQAKNYVSEFGNIIEIEVWAIFSERQDEEKTVWDGSLRSRYIQINDIACNFNGGGHYNACGVKSLTKENITEILTQFKSRL